MPEPLFAFTTTGCLILYLDQIHFLENRRASIFFFGLIALGLLVLTGLTWANFLYASQDRGPNEFFPAWAAARAFLFQGINPYDPAAVTASAPALSGGLLPDEAGELALHYPLHTLLIIAPFALVDDLFLARALWMTLLEAALLGITAASLSLSRWQASRLMLGLVLAFVIIWYFSLRPVLAGDVILLATLAACLAFLAIRSGQDPLAGFMLSLALIKGEVYSLLVLFILLWALSQRRWNLIWATLGILVFFFAIGMLFLEDWMLEYARLVVRDYKLLPPLLPRSVLIAWLPGVGRQLGWGLTLLVGGLLVYEWGAAWGKDLRWFYWTACLTLAGTFMVGMPVSLNNLVALLPAFVLVLAIWDQRWGRLGNWLAGLSLLIFSGGVWALALQARRMQLPLDSQPLFFFLTPLTLLLSLLWVRWWATRPSKRFLQTRIEYFEG